MTIVFAFALYGNKKGGVLGSIVSMECPELCRALPSCAELCRAVPSCAELCRAGLEINGGPESGHSMGKGYDFRIEWTTTAYQGEFTCTAGRLASRPVTPLL